MTRLNIRSIAIAAACVAGLGLFAFSGEASAQQGYGYGYGYGHRPQYRAPVYHAPSVHYDRQYHADSLHWTPGRGLHTHGHYDYVPHYTPGHYDTLHNGHIDTNPYYHHDRH